MLDFTRPAAELALRIAEDPDSSWRSTLLTRFQKFCEEHGEHCDKIDERCVYMTEAFLRLLGHSHEEIVQ
jgi:hypothetical protein